MTEMPKGASVGSPREICWGQGGQAGRRDQGAQQEPKCPGAPKALKGWVIVLIEGVPQVREEHPESLTPDLIQRQLRKEQGSLTGEEDAHLSSALAFSLREGWLVVEVDEQMQVLRAGKRKAATGTSLQQGQPGQHSHPCVLAEGVCLYCQGLQ